MKQTYLMRKLMSRNCSKLFSVKLNKAFDEALENGSSDIIDSENDLAIAAVGNDVVVEDKINDEVTKFENANSNDVQMEAITDNGDMLDTKAECNRPYSRRRTRRYSENVIPTEEYENTPAAGIDSATHEINTLQGDYVSPREGVTDDEKSGTIPFSRRRTRRYSEEEDANNSAKVVATLTEEVKNLVNEVKNIANEVKNTAEEVKNESRRMSKRFCDAATNENLDALVETVNNLKEEVANVAADVKTESRRMSRRFSEEVQNIVNEAMVNNAASNVANNAANNVATDAATDAANNVVNNVAEEVTENAEADVANNAVSNAANAVEATNAANAELQELMNSTNEEVTPVVEVTENMSKSFSSRRSSDGGLDSCLTAIF